MSRAFKRKLYNILGNYNDNGWFSQIDRIFLSTLIILDISSFILETSQQLDQEYHFIFHGVAVFTTIVFTLEYGLRLWLCTVDPLYRHPFWGRIDYALTPLAIVDFISIFPFYLLLIYHNLAFLNTLRLFRLARILKIGRHSKSVRSLVRVVISKKAELLVTFSIVFFLLTIASSLMFFVEHDAQPKIFPSIPAAMWWGVVTLTTVGYGDIYPVTITGKFLGSVLAFLGIGVFVLPAGIIASGFAEEVCNKVEDSASETNSPEPKRRTEITEFLETDRHLQYQQIREEAQLLKYCLQTAKAELTTIGSSEEEINSLAIFLYFQTKQKSLNN